MTKFENIKTQIEKSRVIAFCKKCKKLICEKCLENNHNNHLIKYIKDLEITDDIIENYKSQLYNAFLECDKLYKLKYGNKVKIKVTNLFNSQVSAYFEREDQQIILSLELLQTFLDIYNYHKEGNNLKYQDISNILKHRNIEIIHNKQIIPDKRFEQISNSANDIYKNWNQNKIFNKITPYLKVDLKIKESRTNEINIELNRILKIDLGKKLIKLKNGDLAFSCVSNVKSRIYFIKNLNKDYFLTFCEKIIDFIQLENENISILFKNKIDIYKKENLYYIKNKEIKLGKHKYYYIKNMQIMVL